MCAADVSFLGSPDNCTSRLLNFKIAYKKLRADQSVAPCSLENLQRKCVVSQGIDGSALYGKFPKNTQTIQTCLIFRVKETHIQTGARY